MFDGCLKLHTLLNQIWKPERMLAARKNSGLFQLEFQMDRKLIDLILKIATSEELDCCIQGMLTLILKGGRLTSLSTLARNQLLHGMKQFFTNF